MILRLGFQSQANDVPKLRPKRATMTPSVASMISSMLLMPSWFSIFLATSTPCTNLTDRNQDANVERIVTTLPRLEIILILRPRTPKVFRMSLMSSASWRGHGMPGQGSNDNASIEALTHLNEAGRHKVDGLQRNHKGMSFRDRKRAQKPTFSICTWTSKGWDFKYERMKNIERLWKHSVCKHVLAFLPPFCCFLHSPLVSQAISSYQSQVEDSVSASPKTNSPSSPTLHACGIPNSSKSFLSLSWYGRKSVKPLQWFEKTAEAVHDLAESMAKHWSCVTFHLCEKRLLQYGQVNLHAWKVHVLLFSYGDVVHDLTFHTRNRMISLVGVHQHSWLHIKKHSASVITKSSPQLLTFKDNDPSAARMMLPAPQTLSSFTHHNYCKKM